MSFSSWLRKLNRSWMLLVAMFLGALAAAPALAQDTVVSGARLSASLGDQTGAFRSGPFYLYPEFGQPSGKVALKISGNYAFQSQPEAIDNSADGTIDGLMLVENEQGWVLLYFETDRIGWGYSAGSYQIVDAGGAYLGATGTDYIEIRAFGNGYSDEANPYWGFFLH